MASSFLEDVSFMAAIGPEDLGRLFDRHASALVLYARQWTDAPEDIVQDAFLQLARQRRLPDEPAAWLHRVVRNQAITAARRARNLRARELRAAGPEGWFAASDDQLDARHAAALLAELDPDCREVIVARIWGGLTLEQVARLQGCSVATAHRRYHAGLSRLQERLDPSWKNPARETT